ncbi:MAG: hypothetical protein Q4F33_02475 [Mycoplasmatota bacterium]|nr:hypothetical protein [Mycoplasmatota bacterium]
MKRGKTPIFPVVLTVVMIVIIIYLFATVKQPLVVCEKRVVDDLGITISEQLDVTIDGNKIGKMELVKTIKLPDNYLEDDKYLNSLMFTLENSYDYLDSKKVNVTKMKNSVSVRVEIDKDETIILNNIEFVDNGELQMRINSNTKSSEVVTLKIRDNYTEGELMTRMRNNGYSCR